jgi:methionyl-tRNA synthetase
MVAAEQEGLSSRELADRYNEVIREDLRRLGLSYDIFTRTTTQNHYAVVRDVFRTLHEKGYIVEHTAMGAFSSSSGHTLPDRYIEGTCPHCGYKEARGDQCDNCGRQLDPIDLGDPRSKIDGTTPVFKETSHLFLDLPAFADALREWIDRQRHWRTNVRRFSLNLLDELIPRAITRDLDWGVPVPVEGFDGEDSGKRIYVWFDAVIGYLSSTVEWAAARGTPDAWRDWWQNPDSRHYYFMGKDNIVFHTVIWPSMLLGYGAGGEIGAGKAKLELPYDVVASEFLTMEGRKFSSSRGVVIFVKDFLERYDADALRYFLTIAGPESQDTDFTWTEFVRRNNDELVATWGNLVNRTLKNVHRHFGEVPAPGPLTKADEDVIAAIEAGLDSVGAEIEAARFKAGLIEAMRLAGLANQYVSEQAPWKLIEPERERAATILYVALRCVDNLKLLFSPFLPFSSQVLHELLGYDDDISGKLEFVEHREEGDSHLVLTGDYAALRGRWQASSLPVGQKLLEPKPLFRKLDAEVVAAEELKRMEEEASA